MTTPALRLQHGGDPGSDTLLLLLHGLGATGEVWSGLHALLRERRWPGHWITPDLPGHGGSAPLPAYGFAPLAAALAPAIPPARRLLVLSHSLGGAVALELASGRHGRRVDALGAIGIKFTWTAEEIARTKALSLKPNPVFATRREAAERHLKLAGLAGLVAPEAVSDAAVMPVGEGWSVAFDPRAFDVGTPDLPAMLAAAADTKIVLAAGERDAMCPAAPLLALWPGALILPGLGHNAQVEQPEALWSMLERLT